VITQLKLTTIKSHLQRNDAVQTIRNSTFTFL